MENYNITFEPDMNYFIKSGTDNNSEQSSNIESFNTCMKNHYISDNESFQKDTPSTEDFAYEAKRIIGYGSFGVVFQAEDLKTKDTVAIKKILREKGHKSREIQIWKH